MARVVDRVCDLHRGPPDRVGWLWQSAKKRRRWGCDFSRWSFSTKTCHCPSLKTLRK